MNEGIIYIARNPAYKEDIYKVGKTERTNISGNRMMELSNHEGVVDYFKAVGYLLVDNVNESEKICHEKLKDYRYQNNKEFFQINLKDLVKQIRSILDDFIIRDNLPKFKKQDEDKELSKSNKPSEGLEKFYNKINDLMIDFLWWAPETKQKLTKDIIKQFKKIPNQLGPISALPGSKFSSPWLNGAETAGNVYCLELMTDYKDFVGFDTFWLYSILEKEDIKKNYPEESYHSDWNLEEVKKIELILQNDPEYLNKCKKTRNKLSEIYNNDQLYVEYGKENSKTTRSFNILQNYIFYAFFNKFKKKEALQEVTDGKKVWKEKHIIYVEPKTVFFKGSAERIITELSDIIKYDSPDPLIKLPLDESNSVIKICPECKTKIRLPKGKSGKVNCPNCGERFHTAT